jgi:hypothetical protein
VLGLAAEEKGEDSAGADKSNGLGVMIYDKMSQKIGVQVSTLDTPKIE